jgi:hypothetical protein
MSGSMAQPPFSSMPDDDMPLTLRRKRDAQRAATAKAEQDRLSALEAPPGEPGMVVRGFDVPLFRLMGFLIKCVVAGIPAVVLLGLILFAIGQVAQTYFPWLVKMRIVVTFPG